MIRQQNIRVYVTDDDSVRRSFIRLLKSADLNAEMLSSPEESLGTSQQEDGAGIIADIRMSGLTGFDFVATLASRGIHTPIITISARDDAQTREYTRSQGVLAFFRKPIDDHVLLDDVWLALTVAKKNKRHTMDTAD